MMAAVTACLRAGGTLLALAMPVVALAQPAPDAAAPDSAASEVPRQFPVYAYKVVGNTVLSTDEVEEAVTPYLGPYVTEGDVEQARRALEKIYTDKGYATVAVVLPSQSIDAAVIRLEVVEQTIGRVRVAGARFYSPDRIRAKAPSLQPGAVPNLNAVQRDIVALNQQPDRSVTPELAVGAAPNTIDVNLNVVDKFPAHGSVELNNRSSVNTKALRVAGSLEYGNLWQRGDTIQVGAQFAPERPKDSTVFSGSYTARIPDSLATLRLGGTYSNSDVSTLGSVNVLGKGYTVGLRLALPLTQADGFSQSIGVGFDYKNFRDRTRLALSPSDPEYIRLRCDLNAAQAACQSSFVTPVEYVPLTAEYQASWYADKASTNLGLAVVFAFRGLGSDTPEFDLKRYLARPNFFYLRGNAGTQRGFAGDWQASIRGNAQWSPDPLISNEEFSIGGVDSVRGYYESEALGDYGGSVQIEVATPSFDGLFHSRGPDGKKRVSSSTDRRFSAGIQELRFHAFADGGVAYIHDALPEQSNHDWLASVGAGVRIRAFGYLSGGLDVAFPLIDGPSTRSDGSPVFRFRVGGDF